MTLFGTAVPNHEIIRSDCQMNIHYLLIFNKSGTCLYARNFSKYYNLEENLITGFCTAFMSFSMEMIGRQIKSIEMGSDKFVLFEKEQFHYGLLCNSIGNLALLEEIIEKINICFDNYIKTNKVNIRLKVIYDKELDIKVDSILREMLNKDYNLEKEKKIVDYLRELTLNEEIKGIFLLLDNGKIVYSSLNKGNLKVFLKEIDFRVKICNNSILKLFYTSKNNELIFSEYIEDLYIAILVFDINTKFGVAGFYIQKLVEYIEKILES